MPTPLEQLQNLRRTLVNNQFSDTQMRQLVVTDTDGRTVSLKDPDILAVFDRRIAAEQARSS